VYLSSVVIQYNDSLSVLRIKNCDISDKNMLLVGKFMHVSAVIVLFMCVCVCVIF